MQRIVKDMFAYLNGEEGEIVEVNGVEYTQDAYDEAVSRGIIKPISEETTPKE